MFLDRWSLRHFYWHIYSVPNMLFLMLLFLSPWLSSLRVYGIAYTDKARPKYHSRIWIGNFFTYSCFDMFETWWIIIFKQNFYCLSGFRYSGKLKNRISCSVTEVKTNMFAHLVRVSAISEFYRSIYISRNLEFKKVF